MRRLFILILSVLALACAQRRAAVVVVSDDMFITPEWTRAVKHYESYKAAGGKDTPLIELLHRRMKRGPGPHSHRLESIMDHYLSYREGKEGINDHPYAREMTALFECDGFVTPEALHEIFAEGADPNLKDEEGYGALAFMVGGSDWALEEYLRAGADVYAPVTPDGKCAMDFARAWGDEKLVKRLKRKK